MRLHTSILEDLLAALPHLKPQIYFKSSLVALSHAMEDQILAGSSDDTPLAIATFQSERFYRLEAGRYARIAKQTPQVYVLSAPETEFQSGSHRYETIAFDPSEPLSREWNLVVLSERYGSCLVCEERTHSPIVSAPLLTNSSPDADPVRRFEGIWTFDRDVVVHAADLLLQRIETYRPELAAKVAEARDRYSIRQRLHRRTAKTDDVVGSPIDLDRAVIGIDPEPFAERLISYLQAGQYKLLKAYRSISAQERKERLINTIVSTIRSSLDTGAILDTAVREIGQVLSADRCIIYRCRTLDREATIEHEYCAEAIQSLKGQKWTLADNPLFHGVMDSKEAVFLEDTSGSATAKSRVVTQILHRLNAVDLSFRQTVKHYSIRAWLMVPVLYQGQVLGIVELHHCHTSSSSWTEEEVELVATIATQIGTALIQAETHEHLEDLNEQLEALERTRSNLIAITGHELRTPLSTIQICLESLANEPDMPEELRQVMLTTALTDAERLRELVQDFLTLSRFESGRVEWTWEPLALRECVDLARSSLHTYDPDKPVPLVEVELEEGLPFVSADGEWLVQVLSKLLDNACKFTPKTGSISIKARFRSPQELASIQGSTSDPHPAALGLAEISPLGQIEVTVADTGRGIEPDRLEIIFERFYQEEGALQRSVGGTGLGLAICRQAVGRWGGKIWAESEGKDRGSQFHFTIPVADLSQATSQEARTVGGTSLSRAYSTPYRRR
ncbi:MAG: GAF domain-containing protein [Oscillatoriales cyanobacterium]|nr:MAG: GAF domain-containing protein [Oscillatoriales cyanobacterium]